jgi:hypothetical protein
MELLMALRERWNDPENTARRGDGSRQVKQIRRFTSLAIGAKHFNADR